MPTPLVLLETTLMTKTPCPTSARTRPRGERRTRRRGRRGGAAHRESSRTAPAPALRFPRRPWKSMLMAGFQGTSSLPPTRCNLQSRVTSHAVGLGLLAKIFFFFSLISNILSTSSSSFFFFFLFFLFISKDLFYLCPLFFEFCLLFFCLSLGKRTS